MKCLRLRPAAMARRVLLEAAAPSRAPQQLPCRIPRIRVVVENPSLSARRKSAATQHLWNLEQRQHSARKPCMTRQQRRALQRARAGLLRYDRRASPYSSISHTCAHTRSIYHLLSLQLFSAAPPIMIFCHVVHHGAQSDCDSTRSTVFNRKYPFLSF